jgi:hypothetical protein
MLVGVFSWSPWWVYEVLIQKFEKRLFEQECEDDDMPNLVLFLVDSPRVMGDMEPDATALQSDSCEGICSSQVFFSAPKHLHFQEQVEQCGENLHSFQSSKKYYTVAKGRIPGIYRSWANCERQVTRFSGASFKSFRTRLEAEQFMASSGLVLKAVPFPKNSRS